MDKTRTLTIMIAVLTGLSFVGASGEIVSAAACAPSGDYGTSATTVDIPATGTYKVWSRMQSDSGNASNNSYFLEIDGSACIVVGDYTAISGSQWTWVDYKDGSTASKVLHDFTTIGSHSVKLIGREPNVRLDRVIFTQDMDCVPTGTGDNCALSTTETTNPAFEAEDINQDGFVNLLDFSLLAGKYGQTGGNLGREDINSDGIVNLLDFSLLAGKFGQ